MWWKPLFFSHGQLTFPSQYLIGMRNLLVCLSRGRVWEASHPVPLTRTSSFLFRCFGRKNTLWEFLRFASSYAIIYFPLGFISPFTSSFRWENQIIALNHDLLIITWWLYYDSRTHDILAQRHMQIFCYCPWQTCSSAEAAYLILEN